MEPGTPKRASRNLSKTTHEKKSKNEPNRGQNKPVLAREREARLKIELVPATAEREANINRKGKEKPRDT